ncbi:hypothetical protein CR513_61554, partial [Mucuna pruriens]
MACSDGNFPIFILILDCQNFEKWYIKIRVIFGLQIYFIDSPNIDSTNFKKISGSSTLKEAWNILNKCYIGANKLKKIRLKALRREYITRILNLTNLMKTYGEIIIDVMIIDKVFKTLIPRFNHVMVAIEE